MIITIKNRENVVVKELNSDTILEKDLINEALVYEKENILKLELIFIENLPFADTSDIVNLSPKKIKEQILTLDI